MVSIRCKMVVKAELEKLNLRYTSIELGSITLLENITSEERAILKLNLLRTGLELLDDQKSLQTDAVKKLICDMIFYSDEFDVVINSEYISKQLNRPYSEVASAFSEITGITIQQYIINQKIEKIKELLIYDKLNITEIAYRLNYSSAAHLCNQFKKVTGLTPSYFKKLRKKKVDLTYVGIM